MAVLTIDREPSLDIQTTPSVINSNAVASNNPIYWSFSGAFEILSGKIENSTISPISFDTGFTNNNQGVFIDSNNLYLTNDLEGNIKRYDISSGLNNAVLQETSISINSLDLCISGNNLYSVNSFTGNVDLYDISSGLSTMTLVSSYSVTSEFHIVYGVNFYNNDLYVCGENPSAGARIAKYNNLTSFPSITLESFQDITGYGISHCIYVNSEYIYVGHDSRDITQYSQENGFSNLSFVSSLKADSYPAPSDVITGLYLDSNNIYVCSSNNSNIYTYNRAFSTETSEYIEFTIKSYVNDDSNIQTVQTRREIPFSDETIPIFDISNTIQNYTDFKLPTSNQESQDTYFARVQYESYLNGLGRGVQTLPDIQILQASKQQGDLFGQNMGEYVIQTEPITSRYDLPITLKKPIIYDGYPFYLTTYYKTPSSDFSFKIDLLDINKSTDITEINFSQSFNLSSTSAIRAGLAFNNDGSKMYIVDDQIDGVREYNLSINFDISTLTFIQNFNISAQDTRPRGISFNNDGSKMYVIGDDSNSVHEYDLSNNFDISTASFSQSFDVSAQDTSPREVIFNNDGSKMYISGVVSTSVHEYNLSTNFDISTASILQSFDVSAQDTIPTGVSFNNNGSKMYVLGFTTDSVHEYNLSSSYNISTASFSQTFDVSAQDTSPRGITFNNDDTKMFTIGDQSRNVYEYNVGTDSIETITVNSLNDKAKEVLNIETYLNDNAKFAQAVVQYQGIDYTNALLIEYNNKYVNKPFYVIYENTLGGLDHLMFSVNQNYLYEVDEIGRFKNNELDLSIRDSYEDSTGFETTREVECFAEVEAENEIGILNLLVSKNIFKVETDGSYQKINIQPSSYELVKTENNIFDFKVTFDFPKYNSL